MIIYDWVWTSTLLNLYVQSYGLFGNATILPICRFSTLTANFYILASFWSFVNERQAIYFAIDKNCGALVVLWWSFVVYVSSHTAPNNSHTTFHYVPFVSGIRRITYHVINWNRLLLFTLTDENAMWIDKQLFVYELHIKRLWVCLWWNQHKIMECSFYSVAKKSGNHLATTTNWPVENKSRKTHQYRFNWLWLVPNVCSRHVYVCVLVWMQTSCKILDYSN